MTRTREVDPCGHRSLTQCTASWSQRITTPRRQDFYAAVDEIRNCPQSRGGLWRNTLRGCRVCGMATRHRAHGMRSFRTVLLATLALTVIAYSPGVPSARAESAFVWPLDPKPRIVRPFDPPEHDWLPGHRGVDLDAQSGQPVFAAGDGVVVFAGPVAGRPVVSIDHEGGLRTTYEPVDSLVDAGHRVRRGQPIGTVTAGHAGCDAVCLHWGVRRDRVYLDPVGLVRSTPVRLKPLAG